MKCNFIKAISFVGLLAFVSCSEDIVIENNLSNGVINKISITGADFKCEDGTRSSVSIGESGASFTWGEKDTIGIFPNKGSQAEFAMSEGAGTQTATFSGGGWALKSSATYSAYYPYNFYNRDMTKIPVSYVGQTQNGNNNTDHIGAYDFMAASVATPSNGAVAFDMQHLGALVQLTISVPEPSTLTKIILSSQTEFTKIGTIDLTAETPAIITDNLSNTFEISLSNVSTTEANENVIVYFMTAPVDLTGSEIIARIYFADETIREVEIAGKDLQAGKAYKLAANIEANFYLDGVAYMSNAGVLSEIISAKDLKTISSLKIVGKINGSDIITLESMSALKSLDLSKANIVSGGLPYEYREIRDEDTPVYTENNVIGYGMFNNFGFEEIVLPKNITSIQQYAFSNCLELTSITIPDNVASIGSACFSECKKLQHVNIPNGVTYLGESTFENCISLTSIDLPNSITSIYSKAFYGCSNLESIVIPPVERINEGTFGFCTSLATVEIPNTVTRIDEDAFSNCKELQQVTLPNSVTYLSGFMASGLTEISIPSSVTTIGSHAFHGCKNLSTLTIPEGIKTIAYDAFNGCTALNGPLAIPNTVTQIGDQAFYSCSSLTSINLSENLTYIGMNAFRNCSGVNTLKLPSKVQTIGNSAFAGMKLTSMTALMKSPPYDSDPFWNGEDTSKIPFLYVPFGCKDKYESNLNWKNYFNSIVELQD